MNCFETETTEKHYKANGTLRVRIDTTYLGSLILQAFQRFFSFVGYKLATPAIWLPFGTVVPFITFSS